MSFIFIYVTLALSYCLFYSVLLSLSYFFVVFVLLLDVLLLDANANCSKCLAIFSGFGYVACALPIISGSSNEIETLLGNSLYIFHLGSSKPVSISTLNCFSVYFLIPLCLYFTSCPSQSINVIIPATIATAVKYCLSLVAICLSSYIHMCNISSSDDIEFLSMSESNISFGIFVSYLESITIFPSL